MADLTVTAAQVAQAYAKSGKAEIYDVVAGATITAGQPVYIDSNGDAQLTDASAAGTAQVAGIALNGGGAGQAISVIHHGCIYGFDLSGIAYWGLAYLSDTAGTLADGVGTVTVPVGRVVPLSDSDRTKVLFVDIDITTANYA
jgi:hypothetical protein